MATQVQFRRGTTAQHAGFTGADGELTIDTDKETVVVHDNATAGGYPLLRNVVEDLTPQLGGNLDLNSFSLIGPAVLDSASTAAPALDITTPTGNLGDLVRLSQNSNEIFAVYGETGGGSETVMKLTTVTGGTGRIEMQNVDDAVSGTWSVNFLSNGLHLRYPNATAPSSFLTINDDGAGAIQDIKVMAETHMVDADLVAIYSGNETIRTRSDGQEWGNAVFDNYTIRRADTAGQITISGGNVANVGGAIRLYGSTHATQANDIDVMSGGAVLLRIVNDGTIQSETAGYETLVVADNVMANKKYVDDADALSYTKLESDGAAGSAGAKADKVTGSVAGNFAGLDAGGNLTNSGSAPGSFATAAQGTTADSAVQPGDNVSTLVNDANYQGQVVPGTVGDFAALDASGNIIDGGAQASDFATAAQGTTADSAVQPSDNVSTLTNDAGYTTDATVATNHYTKTESDATGPAAGAKVDKVAGVSGNVVEFGASNAIADSGVATSALAPLASPAFTGVPVLPTYTIGGGLPPVGAGGGMIYVSDATGSGVTGSMCFSNGTSWIDVTTGIAVV